MDALSAIGKSAGDIRTDYLKLLVTQLRTQDPLDPMDNNQMVAQLTQMSQLEQAQNQTNQLQQIGEGFQQVLQRVQLAQATGLLGKQVTFRLQGADGQETQAAGVVENVQVSDGQPKLTVGDATIALEDVLSISR